MQKKPAYFTRKDGSFRLEAMLFLMILGVLAFLAIPVYNTLQKYQKNKADSSSEPAAEVNGTNASEPHD